jgi:hypothetical protein
LPRTVSSVDAGGGVLSRGESSGHMTVVGMTAGVRF